MGGHLRLPGQSHLSRVLGRLDTYGGTFEIAWSISFVHDTKGRLDPYEGHLRLTCQSHLSGVTWEAGHLWRTCEIDWSISYVPLLNWGTNDIDWATSYVLGQSHMSPGRYHFFPFLGDI